MRAEPLQQPDAECQAGSSSRLPSELSVSMNWRFDLESSYEGSHYSWSTFGAPDFWKLSTTEARRLELKVYKVAAWT